MRAGASPAAAVAFPSAAAFAVTIAVAAVVSVAPARAEPAGAAGAAAPAARALAPAAAPTPAALFAKFECARCHEGVAEVIATAAGAAAAAAVAAPPLDKQCTGCHRQILAGTFDAPKDAVTTWQMNLVSLRQAPSLAGLGRRLRRQWIRDFLLQPHDLRPAMGATMPRLAVTPAEADALAAALAPAPEASPARFAAADVDRGRAVYEQLRCATCHAFSGATVADIARPPRVARGHGDRAPPDGIALAPDLAVTRARFQTGLLAAWLRDPQRFAPGSTMPSLPEVPDDDLRALAAFVTLAPLAPPTLPAPPARLPPLARRVHYTEVESEVLRKICWHCHSLPDLARGDGGPGNTGGLGFAPRGLDLSSYSGAAAGARGDDGRRHSIFLPGRDGATPLVVERLLARQREEAGRPDADLRGMPLGFPSLTPRQIQLVESWVVQGRPP